MPLEGADDGGLFCIMLPQPIDRSIKALEMLRPYEHAFERDATKPFANEYMLLAIRNRENQNGVLHTVRMTLSSTELEKTPQRGRLQKVVKRKQQLAVGNDLEPQDAAKRSRVRLLTGPRTSTSLVQLSDDDMADPLPVPNARCSTTMGSIQAQSPTVQRNFPRLPPFETATPQAVNTSYFTDDQALRIQFHWKVDYDGMELDFMRTLDDIKSFRTLLDTFREEAEGISPAAQHIQSSRWILMHRLNDSKGMAKMISLTTLRFERNFNDFLRTLAENQAWKEDSSAIIRIELKAMPVSSVM